MFGSVTAGCLDSDSILCITRITIIVTVTKQNRQDFPQLHLCWQHLFAWHEQHSQYSSSSVLCRLLHPDLHLPSIEQYTVADTALAWRHLGPGRTAAIVVLSLSVCMNAVLSPFSIHLCCLMLYCYSVTAGSCLHLCYHIGPSNCSSAHCHWMVAILP